MPRHAPPKNVQDDDTIVLFLRSMFNLSITIELKSGLEYNGILTDLSTDRYGKSIWLTLSHVTAKSPFNQIMLFKPPEKPKSLQPKKSINNQEIFARYDDPNIAQSIISLNERYPILTQINSFDYEKFLLLNEQQQGAVVDELVRQDLYERENYEEYGQYLSQTTLQMSNITKFHCPPHIDFLNQIQSYINRLQQTQRRELKGKGRGMITGKEKQEEIIIMQLKAQYPDLSDEIDRMMTNSNTFNPNDEFNKRRAMKKEGKIGQNGRNNNNNTSRNHKNDHNLTQPTKRDTFTAGIDHTADGFNSNKPHNQQNDNENNNDNNMDEYDDQIDYTYGDDFDYGYDD